MIRRVKNFIQRYIFSEEIPLRGRTLNLVILAGTLASGTNAMIRFFEGSGPLSLLINICIIVSASSLFVMANKFKMYESACWIAVIMICDILLPLFFFTNGGIESGMPGFLVMSIVLIFLVLEGKGCIFMAIFNMIEIAGCYLLSRRFPGLVIRFSSEIQRLLDHIQTIYITGIFIGLVIKFQIVIYNREKTKAEAASRAKAEFLANVSHEIRTPLNAIIGLGELELRKNLDEGTRKNQEKINESGKILLSIINDLLDVSKIESGRFELIPVEYSAASAINDTVNLNMIHIGKKPIQFSLSVDERIPSVLYGDELRIRQMLNNLLSNAFKYTKEGTVNLAVTVENLAAPAAGETVWFTFVIRDSGIGIRKEDIGRLFTAYNQVDVRNNRAIQGTGLGLSICKNLSTLMGGSISVESEYGKGSAFTVRIPQVIVNPQPLGSLAARNLEKFGYNNIAIRERRKQLRFQLSYARVLVVDDVPINLDVAAGMLQPYGPTVDCVESGAEAVRLIRDHREHYDAIFMDHMMPGMDGIETVRIIRNEIDSEYARTIPVIALTANALVGNDKIFLEKGFQDFLTKPIDSIKLDAALNKWVRNRELEKQNQPTAGEPLGAESAAAEPEAAESAAAEPEAILGVDFAAGVARMGNREDAYLKILASYASKLPALLDKIRQVEAGTLGDYAITIHGIKGASYGICADETGKAAAALEAAAKQGDLASVQADNGSFILAAEQLTAAITRFLDSRPS